YLDNAESFEALTRLGFDQSAMIENDGAQAYVLQSESDCVVVCRGTERTEWNDVRASLDFFTVPAATRGRVHRGFDREVDDLWPTIEPELAATTKRLWFTGHSLGGAMAMICALRCRAEYREVQVEELYTFGSPRVGTDRYVRSGELTHIRWVNNNDIVARVPPPFFGYRHAGELVYLDRNGRVAALNARQRAEDRWQGLKATWGRNAISDHAIAAYVRLIDDARA
ncbi:MAG: lipase family protein, partial [Acidimicrobiales bacterium]